MFRFLGLLLLFGIALAILQVILYTAEPHSPDLAAPPQANIAQITPVSLADRYIVERDGDGLFYINGHVNGVRVRFAIDTGASVVVLNAADATRVGLEANQPSHHRIRTASGYSPMTWQQVDNVTIGGRVLGEIDIAIMEDGPAVSLLGLNALSRLGSVTMKDDQLIIGY